MAVNCPFVLGAQQMNNTWVRVRIKPEWITIVLQHRDGTAFQIRPPEDASHYFSVAANKSITLNSHNFVEDEYVEVKAASGIVEVMGFIRK